MSFIYGIINLEQQAVNDAALHSLATAVKWEGFQEHAINAKNYALGYCHHPERKPKAGIFEFENLIVLADIRIYNTSELQTHFSFESPEEAFAKAYLKWGLDCANYINGDFAVVVYDQNKNEVHLFRDHIGARPLTYFFDGNQLIFASHEFGIAKSKLIDIQLCETKFINDFFQIKGNYEQTVFETIFKVKPAFSISFSANTKHENHYWNPKNINTNKEISFNNAAQELQTLLVNATKNRIESGKNGVHVSGGLDSTGVAAILADTITDKSQLIGYSWTPEKLEGDFEGVDEKVLIETFATDKQLKINYLQLEENELCKDFLIPEFEKMSIEHPTMKAAAKDQVTTIFSGWGGDEFLSLSTRGTYNHLFFNLQWKTLIRFTLKTGIKPSIMRFRTEVLPILVPFGLLPVYHSTGKSTVKYLESNFKQKHLKKIFLHSKKNIFGFNRKQFVLNLLYNYHIPERMDSWTLHAERYGLEYKYPLLDKKVLDFWFSLPIEFTYHNMQSRLLYREVMKGILTECIRVRRDKGEGMRITYTKQKRKEDQVFIKNLFHSLKSKDHLPYFDHKKIKKALENSIEIESDKNEFATALYLRYVALTQKYLS